MEADPVLLRAALINIIENAVEACMKETSTPAHRILYTARREADHVRIDITEDGADISPDIRKKLFTLFFFSKGHKGARLGLFTARKEKRPLMVNRQGLIENR